MRWVQDGMHITRVLARLGVVLTLAGCGSDSDEDGGGGGVPSGPLSIEQLPGALSQTLCQALAPCCAEVGIPLGSQCGDAIEASIRADYQSADPANYEYDPVLAGNCVQQLRSATGDSCGALQSTTSPIDLSCNDVVQGRLEPGAACASSIECAHEPNQDAECDSQDGICVVEWRGVAGDACYWTCTEDGNGGTSCSGSGTETPNQARCFLNDSLYCSAAGVCEPQVAVGGACTNDDACMSDAHCDFASSMCEPRGEVGAACTSDTACVEGAYCKDSACVANLAPGSACEDFVDECQDGFCDAGTCTESTGDLGTFGAAFVCAFLAGGGFTVTPQQP